MTMGQIADVLGIALDVLEDPDCWCKGSRHLPSGRIIDQRTGLQLQDRHCAIGALEIGFIMTTGLDWTRAGIPEKDPTRELAQSYRRARGLLDSYTTSGPCECEACGGATVPKDIVFFNDHPTTTHEDVVLVFKHAYVDALEQGI